MGICIIHGCGRRTDDGRMLCSRHAAQGLMGRADGVCQRCFQRAAQSPGMLCNICEAERQAEKAAQHGT